MSPSGAVPSDLRAYAVDPLAQALVTFEVHPDTGQLRVLQSLPAPWPELVAADPDGRFLYLAGGPFVNVRSYTIDPRTGQLSQVSHEAAQPSTLSPALSLAANPRQVYVVGGSPFTGTHGGWQAFDVDPSTGRLSGRPLPRRFEPQFAVAERTGRFVYSHGRDLENGTRSTIYVNALRNDDRLAEIQRIQTPPGALAAVLGRRFLFVTTGPTWEPIAFAVDEATGQVTAPGNTRDRGDDWERPANLALSPDERLLAMGTHRDLSLFAVGTGGDLTLRESLPLPLHTSLGACSVVFHPGGGFLYASHPGEGVGIYRIGSDGSLALSGRTREGGGSIAMVRLRMTETPRD